MCERERLPLGCYCRSQESGAGCGQNVGSFLFNSLKTKECGLLPSIEGEQVGLNTFSLQT